MKRKILLVLFIAIMGLMNANAQSRGPTPGEFYINLPWYFNINTELHHAMIAYTNNNGRNLQALYTSVENSGEMQVGTIYADATPNVLYNRPGDLYRSFDNGQTWEFVEAQTGEYPPGYATGNINNEIFKQSQGVIYKSEANGNNWVQMSTDIPGRMEVGNQPGELYAYSSLSKYDDGWYYETKIRHSLNDGADFVIDTLDVSFTGNSTSNSPRIIRGAQEGEFYLVSWWLGPKFKVFHSYNYWYNFEFKYEQPENAYMWDEMFAFSAGRGECEFYAFKLKTYVDGYYFRLHVYHSSDCAQTFTEYIHELTPDYDGNPDQIIYTIAAKPTPAEGGEIAGAGYYHEGEEVNLMATPHDGYTFQNWTENGNPFSDEPELSFTADSTRKLEANFQPINSIANLDISSISIYPNPAIGNVYVNIKNIDTYRNLAFEFINLYGQCIMKVQISKSTETIDISNLPTGMYIYRFTADDLIIKTGKLIIN
jgi:hypothetical protein